MKKRILSLILTLCMLVSMLTIVPMTANAVDPEEWDVWDGTSAAPYNSEGSGTAADPFIIRTAEQWANLATATAAGIADGYYIKLAANLDFAKRTGLTPISPDGKRLLIYFDGDGHTIKGVNMEGTEDGIGLFGDIWGNVNTGTKTSNIKNLVITDSTFTSTSKYIGALIGETSGHVLVENIYVDKSVIVNGTQGNVGGIIGGCYRPNDKNSQEYTVTINDCVFAGTVISGGEYNGGILGFANSAKGNGAEIIHVVINRCLVTGIVSPNQVNSCGFQGSNGFMGYEQTQSTTINDSIYAGGSRGEYYSYYPFGKARTMTVTNSYSVSIGRMDAMYEDHADYLTTGVTLCSIDKFIGLNAEVTVNGWTKRVNDIMVPEAVASLVPALYWDVWDGTSAAPYNSVGSGTAADPYIIRTAEQWANLATATATRIPDGYYIKLAANLDFAKLPGLTPISPDGKRLLIYFDGDGHTIKGVNMTGAKDGIGLFGDIWGDANTGTKTSNIKNLVITDSTFTSTKKYIGALIGETSGHVLVENIYVDKSVIVNGAQGYVGGIIGGCYRDNKTSSQEEYTVTINDCVFAGTVISGGTYNGGILGFANSANNNKEGAEIIHVVINRCLVTGIVSPNQENSCGFLGSNGYMSYEQTQSTTINDSIYAGGSRGEYYSYYPFGKARTMTVTNSYSVSIGRKDAMYEDLEDYLTTGVTLCSIDKFIGLNAEVTVNGWTKRDGDIMIPSGVANFAGTGTVIGELTLPGAAVRMLEPTGLRFSGIIAKAYLDSVITANSGATITYGMIIAPTAYVTAAGEFTIEALTTAGKTYKEVEALSDANSATAAADGFYKFHCVLATVREENYTHEFSAITYIKIVNGENTTYIYADTSTSRSIEYVAEMALADLSDTKVGEYQYAVTEGEITRYSPYDVVPRGILLGFTQGTQE